VGDAVSRGWWQQTIVWWPWLLTGSAAAAWWVWWRLPNRQVDRARLPDPKERADAEDNFRKTSGQLLGGAAVLIGAGIAYLQFTQQQQASQQQFSRQQQAAHDLLISNQVSKGFELLGNKDGQLEQRLGGVYALEGVTNTSEYTISGSLRRCAPSCATARKTSRWRPTSKPR